MIILHFMSLWCCLRYGALQAGILSCYYLNCAGRSAGDNVMDVVPYRQVLSPVLPKLCWEKRWW